MKELLSKLFVPKLDRILGISLLLLLNEFVALVISTNFTGKSCFLYPINNYEPSPWFSIKNNYDTTVILENMPIFTPVNITLRKYQSEDTFCLISVRLERINIYGSCLIGDKNNFTLDKTIDDKTLVLHVHETIFQLAIEDVMVILYPLSSIMSELEHDTPERIDKENLAQENSVDQYEMQIKSDVVEEERLHAAVGCEYDTDDECVMEFERTILIIKNETTLMALSNSSKLEGEVFVHYGNSEFKRNKPLVITLPTPSDEEADTWEEVANVAPQFIEREESETYILYLDKNLIFSPRSPGLVGTVQEKELILDFTKTKNVKWGVPCPEKPESLNLNFTVVSTTPEIDAETFKPVISDGKIDSNMLTSMIRGELDQIKAIIGPSDPELGESVPEPVPELVPEPEYNPDNEIDEPTAELTFEEPEGDYGPKKAPVKSNAMTHGPETITLMCLYIIAILTRKIFVKILY